MGIIMSRNGEYRGGDICTPFIFIFLCMTTLGLLNGSFFSVLPLGGFNLCFWVSPGAPVL